MKEREGSAIWIGMGPVQFRLNLIRKNRALDSPQYTTDRRAAVQQWEASMPQPVRADASHVSCRSLVREIGIFDSSGTGLALSTTSGSASSSNSRSSKPSRSGRSRPFGYSNPGPSGSRSQSVPDGYELT
jgi:hypothetical protein